MTLRNLITHIFKTKRELSNDSLDNNILLRENLEVFKDLILETDEFSDANSLTIINRPTITLNGHEHTITTLDLFPGAKFIDDVYLYSISLIMKPYENNNNLSNPVYEDSSVTPPKHNLINDPPKRVVSMNIPDVFFSPTTSNNRFHIHNLLDRILDNPTQYQVRKKYQLRVRGYFSIRTSPTIEYDNSIEL